jgi:hypothetical protein
MSAFCLKLTDETNVKLQDSPDRFGDEVDHGAVL